MRLHHLEMTAFGPFADPVEVDFDALSAGGVFLLTGATGAGKSSVLDAVCFALYGQVPGDRGGARHLRSDHAAPAAPPLVVLRLSIGDRTFRFTRSPAWSRPKQRGSGETRVQAHVVVEEFREGSWAALTNRLDDAGLLVTDLLGMTAAQFTQVAMLPQGRFQAFLRASSTERHAVLQKLFRTDRFERVERWLVERRGADRRASEQAAHQVREVLHRIQEAAAVELPESWTDDLAAAADRGEVAAWSTEIVAAAVTQQERVTTGSATAAAALDEADADLARARRVYDARARAESSARQLVSLAARSDELESLRARLTGHRRAAPLAPLVERARDCQVRAERAAASWQQCARDTDLPPTASRAVLTALHEEAVAARAVAEAFRPRAGDLAVARVRESALSRQVEALAEGLAALEHSIAEQPAELVAVRSGLDDARAAAAGLRAAEQDLATLVELLASSRRHDAGVEELATARIELAEATALALTAKETYLDAREARINGMAAELAGALAVGCACPVCGSASHPSPAHATAGGVGRSEEDAARKAHEDAAFVQQGHEVRVATLVAEVDALAHKLAGIDREGLSERVAESRSSTRRCRSLADQVAARAQALEALETRSVQAREARDRTTVELASTRHELGTVGAVVRSLTDELDDLLDGAGDLDELISARKARCARLEAAAQAFAAFDEATRSAVEAGSAAANAAREAGFDGPAAAGAALLGVEEADSVEATLAEAEASRLAAEQVLADPATHSAMTLEPPDLDVLVVQQRLATDTLRAAASALDSATARQRRLVALDGQLGTRLDAWTPLREQHAQVAALSQLVEGKGPDNPLRIRLAAYVLTERLRQVVAAANERLARMTGQRYSLEHTDDRGAGEQRGGLSLRVRDDWNGVSRDPATLSGGETFVVSLALALGLADTVAHEAGGTDIDTLFIDEGFGSLDSDTLEDVMDTLDTLRDGGRVVGLVSHVPELRSRITHQLEVLKGRNGSTLRAVVAGG